MNLPLMQFLYITSVLADHANPFCHFDIYYTLLYENVQNVLKNKISTKKVN